jgi:DNA replication protein DnaC
MTHHRTLALLRQIGLESREIRAASAERRADICERPQGFGLFGPTGTGKTWAMVQILAAALDALVCSAIDPETFGVRSSWAAWLHWPGQADALKLLVGQGEHQTIADRVELWSSCGMLFLDDLGQERVTGGENDYALCTLRCVLGARYRRELPVYWTSNLVTKDLANLYGSPMVSRMWEAWPPQALQGSDMRLRRAS